jgi:hypothetical protein
VKAHESGVSDAQESPPFQAPNDIFRYTTEEVHSVTAQYTTGNEAAKLRPAPGSREVTLSSSKEVSSDAAIHDAKEGAKGSKKRRKQCPQWVTTTANYDGGNDEKADGSDMEHVAIAARSGKRQARPPTDHFGRLLNEVCPNHAYPVKHKLKDCDMMKNFMISWSLTQAIELDEDPGGSDTIPFPGEDAVMMVYDGCPPPGRCRVSNPSLGTSTHCGWEPRNIGV